MDSEWIDVTDANVLDCRQPGGFLAGEGALAGPEDITIDWTTGAAIISATDRWRNRPVGIFHYEPGSKDSLKEMRVVNAAEGFQEAFRPHGLSLFHGPCSDQSCNAGETVKRLFVINHRADPLNGERRSDVEIFDVVDDETLRHVDIVGSTTQGSALGRSLDLNDLVAIGSKSFYASDNGRGLVRSTYFGGGAVVHFDGLAYHEVVKGLSFANGIAFHPEARLLYVSTTGGKSLHVFDASDPKHPEERTSGEIRLGSLLDNIEWESSSHDALLIAGHDSQLAFLWHKVAKAKTSPSSVWRISLGPDGRPNQSNETVHRLFRSEDDTLPAISVAASRGDRILLGAVFADRMLDCAYRPDLAGLR